MKKEVVNTAVETEEEIKDTTEVTTEMETENKKLKKETEIEMETRSKLRIGIIGCGNAGNQLVSAAYRAGITENLLAINTSKKDLSSEIVSNLIPSFLAGGEGRGSGKDREKAKQLFKENGELLFKAQLGDKTNASYKLIQESDAVIVAFATGGGTGSFIGPALCQILSRMYKSSQKLVIAYGVAPKFSDSAQAHKNSIASIKDCSECNIPILLDDLSKLEEIPYEEAYERIAINFVDYIHTIRGDYSAPSKNGMIDENDTMRMIGHPGYQCHYHLTGLTVEMLEKENIQSRLLKLMKEESPTMTIQKDGIIEYMGVISNYPSSFNEGIHNGDYSKITEYVGIPNSTFENYGEISGTLADVHVILSGMNLPYDKLLKSKEKVEAREKAREKAASFDLGSIIAGMDSDSEKNKIQNTYGIDEEDVKDALSFFK